MKILRRFKYYGIGFGIGLLLSIILFQGRGCEWLPGNRVKGSVMRSDLYANDSIQCLLDCTKMDSAQFYKWVEESEVNFGKSETKKKPRVYRLENDGLKMEFSWKNEGDSTVLTNIINVKDCNCSQGDDLMKPIKF